MTNDPQVMIIAYRLNTCCNNSRHVAIEYGTVLECRQPYRGKVTGFIGLMTKIII